MASPVAPFRCPKCGYVVVYHRDEYREMGIEYMTRHLKCLAVSCDFKDNCTTLASISDSDALFPLGRLYMRQADAERADRAAEEAERNHVVGELADQLKREQQMATYWRDMADRATNTVRRLVREKP